MAALANIAIIVPTLRIVGSKKASIASPLFFNLLQTDARYPTNEYQYGDAQSINCLNENLIWSHTSIALSLTISHALPSPPTDFTHPSSAYPAAVIAIRSKPAPLP